MTASTAAYYPSVSEVLAANKHTLEAWSEKLPPAQTDVQRTVQRRIKVRLQAKASPSASSEPTEAEGLDKAFQEAFGDILTGLGQFIKNPGAKQ